MELMVGCLIATLASTFLMYGISSTTSSVQDIRLEQDALEELIGYTNRWQSYIAAGYDPNSNAFPQGEPVIIGENDNKKGIDATLHYNITEQYTGQYSKYYNIKTWIRWNNSYLTGERSKQLDFELNQMVF